MRTLLTVLITILITLALILGVSFAAAKLTPPEVIPEVAAEPVLETTEATTPPEISPVVEDKLSIDSVPRYYQTDYPHDKFGNGTIATSGCSISCLAMVSTYLTDTEYLPNQMAYHFGSHGKNNIERLIYGNEQMQLPNIRTDNVQDALQAVKEGKVVIAMMDDESLFTSTQHFIVLAGLTPEGKIIINDPLEKTHEPEQEVYLCNGYQNGFEDYDLLHGFSGAWIYDKADMPEEPFLYDASMPEQRENRYVGFTMPEEDIYTLASFIWAAAKDEDEDVQQAVAEVILNRVMSEDFPGTVEDAIYMSEYRDIVKQMPKAKVGMTQYMAVDAATYGPYVLPENVYYFSEWEKNGEIWGTLGRYTFLHTKTK